MSALAAKPAQIDATVAAPSERRAPLAFIIDEESNIRQFVSLILQGSGVDTIEFVDGASFREAPIARAPDMVFLNVSLEVQDAVQSIEMLSNAGFTGAVQLMSNRGSAVLDTVKQAGEQLKLPMLPVLKKPFETSAIQKIMSELKLGHGPAAPGIKISLAETLKNNWVKFWYQPKIDLRRKQLAGAEAFARVCHPQHGVLLPGSFMPGTDDASVLTLAERAPVSALKSGLSLSRFGVNLRIVINVPVNCLVKLPVGQIVREHRPQVDDWPGLMIDVAEEQIVAEMKLDRSFVVGCGTDKVYAPICKTVIDLAHSFGALAVGIGLEKASDAMALVSIGCDLKQGFLFGQPMPEERFIALPKQCVTVRAPTPAAAVAAAALQGA